MGLWNLLWFWRRSLRHPSLEFLKQGPLSFCSTFQNRVRWVVRLPREAHFRIIEIHVHSSWNRDSGFWFPSKRAHLARNGHTQTLFRARFSHPWIAWFHRKSKVGKWLHREQETPPFQLARISLRRLGWQLRELIGRSLGEQRLETEFREILLNKGRFHFREIWSIPG